jgi:UDP-N-acetyl-D-glucosamine/UDP-N-acetyl-D-galactosamine dehydrogenase
MIATSISRPDPEDLRQADFHIIAVPTPIDDHNLPDLKPVLSASETVGKDSKERRLCDL